MIFSINFGFIKNCSHKSPNYKKMKINVYYATTLKFLPSNLYIISNISTDISKP